MAQFSRLTGIVVFAMIAVAGGLMVMFADLLPPRTLEFSGLIVAAILTSVLPGQLAAIEGRRPLSFIVDFASLLLFGPHVATLVATCGPVAHWLVDTDRPLRSRRTFLNVVTVTAAIQAAGLAHSALGGTSGQFVWPWQAIPIGAAVIVSCFVRTASAEVIWPLISRQAMNRSWHGSFVRACPEHVIAASVAVAFVEAIDHGNWEVMLVAAWPLYFAYRAYCASAKQREDQNRRYEVIDALDEGMCVIDRDGRVSLWSDALERLVGCRRDRALGRELIAAVPALGKSELPRAISEALMNRSRRTLPIVSMPASPGTRLLQVKILPVVDGVTLLWHDVTERRRAEQALKRNEERFALAVAGANDGVWEWDLRAEELYLSARWRALVGLPASAHLGRPDDWIGRVHDDDVAGLKEALDAHLSGKTDHLEHEHRIRHEDGTYRQFLCRGIAVKSTGRGEARIAGSLTDTTERTFSVETNQRGGFIDSLTGLSNREVFVKGLGRRLDEFKHRRGGVSFAVLYLDLDRFKVVNDSLGHLVGDELLTAVSRRLESCLRQGDALARLGGDEFAILLNRLGDDQQANAIAFRIQDALSAPFFIGGREVFTSASIGIAVGAAHYSNSDEMMRDADTAMYHAKSRGKARHELFDADMHARVRDRLGLESDLRHAVNNNDFEVNYQPIVSLATGMCVGFESLARWTRGGRPISPTTFIPIAEELGIIEPLGTWVLGEACYAFADWQRRYPGCGLEYITVNVSARQLMQQNFLRVIERAVEKSGLQPSEVRLEITETALMETPDLAAEVLRELREFGVKIYLDDFGTGCSSLSHLHKLPVDALKIDRSFVTTLLYPERPAMVESILALARTLKTSVVAEGIEREAQARELERLGCTHAQGFLFSRPLTVRSVEELLAANQPLGPRQVRPSEPVNREDAKHYASIPFEWPEHVSVRRVAIELDGVPQV